MSAFGISNTRLRLILRYSHLVAGMLVVVFVYSPLGDVPAFELLVQIALIPVTIVTGIWIWQQARVRRLIAKGQQQQVRRKKHRQSPTENRLERSVE